MALSFTDPQLRTISQQVMDAPLELATDNNNVSNAVAKKAELLAKDNANKVYSDNFIAILGAYSEERKYLDGTYYTQYSEASELIPSAREDNNSPHYPISPSIWTKVVPKLIPSMNGSPVLSNTSNVESLLVPIINNSITLLKTGFADGAASTTLDAPGYTPSLLTVLLGTSFSIGNRVVVNNAGRTRSALLNVVSPAPTTTEISTVEVVPPVGSFGTSDNVKNFHPGWTNTEREAASRPDPEVFGYFSGLIDSNIALLRTSLVNQKNAIQGNDALSGDHTANLAEITAINTAIAAIDTWLAAPTSGAGVGRYGNTVLTPLQNAMSTRTGMIAGRISEITTAIGSVSQDGAGVFSGTGYYNDLATWVDLRAGKAGGSLFSYYGMDKIIAFLNVKVSKTIDKIAQYDTTMYVKKFASPATNTDTIDLVDTVGLAVSQSVKIMNKNDADPIITANILAVTLSTVQLDVIVSSTYFTVDLGARLVRLL